MIESWENPIQALPLIFVVCIIYWFTRRASQKKKYGGEFKAFRKKALLNEIIRLIFVAWALECVCCTLLPTGFFYLIRTIPFDNLKFFRPSPRWFNLSLPDELYAIKHMPRENIQQGMLRSLISAYILNVLMFIPLGFTLPFLWKRANLIKVVLIGFLCTLFIEFVQGFMYRDSTIDDVVCNTLGALLGYLLYLIIKKLFPKLAAKASIENLNEH